MLLGRQFYDDIRRWHFQLHCYFRSPKYKTSAMFFWYTRTKKEDIDIATLLIVPDQGGAVTRLRSDCVFHCPVPLPALYSGSSVRLLAARERWPLSSPVFVQWSWMVPYCSQPGERRWPCLSLRVCFVVLTQTLYLPGQQPRELLTERARGKELRKKEKN